MANNILPIGFFFILSLLHFSLNFSKAQKVPAIYVFGDSLVDVGNNNYLELSVAKANFPHNGIDFPTKKATGRFSNGKNAADFIADKLGLPSSPPYLSLKSKNDSSFLTGVSFASGGAGIFDGTDEVFKQAIPLTKQVSFYLSVHEKLEQQLGASRAQEHLSKSLFVIVIGSNDLLDYFGSSLLRKYTTPQQYVEEMLFSLEEQLRKLHSYGARKILVAGIPPIGCCPYERRKSNTEECIKEENDLSAKYNEGLKAMLERLKSELKDINYSFVDTLSVLLNLIQNPSDGFTEVKSACCGLGKLRADVPCLPIAHYCKNRRDHIFWDLYHPTEATASILVDVIFDGPSQYTFPINLKQLIAL
ncbi:hypothetical protein UlMin_016062 [Ulmus minor]